MNEYKMLSTVLREEISHIKNCENIKGAILYLQEFFKILISYPKINAIIKELDLPPKFAHL